MNGLQVFWFSIKKILIRVVLLVCFLGSHTANFIQDIVEVSVEIAT